MTDLKKEVDDNWSRFIEKTHDLERRIEELENPPKVPIGTVITRSDEVVISRDYEYNPSQKRDKPDRVWFYTLINHTTQETRKIEQKRLLYIINKKQ